MDEQKTPPNTNFAKIVEDILGPRLDRFEREACRLISRELEQLGTEIAARVCNALGSWRHGVDADRESTKLKLAELEERIEKLERAHKCDTDIPPPSVIGGN